MLHGAGIFTNIYPINEPNVDKYTIPGAWSIWVFLNRQLGYLSFVEPDILWQLDTVNIRLLYLFHPNTISTWWYTYPSENHEFVSWDDDYSQYDYFPLKTP
jgi:hypothetical protein